MPRCVFRQTLLVLNQCKQTCIKLANCREQSGKKGASLFILLWMSIFRNTYTVNQIITVYFNILKMCKYDGHTSTCGKENEKQMYT